MTDIETVGKVLAAWSPVILGGGLVASYWNWQQHVLEQYRYLDASYADLLRIYREHPDLGDPERTGDYLSHFKGKDHLRYHYFAMTVHTVMETVFDLSRKDRLFKVLFRLIGYRRRTKISKEWSHIFDHHTELHSEWLKQNPGANEPKYVDYVLKRQTYSRSIAAARLGR